MCLCGRHHTDTDSTGVCTEVLLRGRPRGYSAPGVHSKAGKAGRNSCTFALYLFLTLPLLISRHEGGGWGGGGGPCASDSCKKEGEMRFPEQAV
jgi:hypothetical protein